LSYAAAPGTIFSASPPVLEAVRDDRVTLRAARSSLDTRIGDAMTKPIPINSEGRRLMEMYPTRFFDNAEEAMSSSDAEVAASSAVWLLPCGVYTWVDDGGLWIHPESQSPHSLDSFYERPVDEDGRPDESKPGAIEIAHRITTDHPTGDNFGPWEYLDDRD
jgi:hypothetical protein